MAADETFRILVALDACSELTATLAESVAAMAARLDAELEGLFVEDAELLRAAELPFVREVSAAGVERSFTAEGLRALNRDVSRNLEQLLARVADARKLRWQYRRAHGSRLATAYAASAQCDLFVPGRQVRRHGQRQTPERVFHRIGVIVSDSTQAKRALSVVRALAVNGHTREVLLVSEGQPPGDLVTALSAAGLRTYIQTTSLAEPASLLEAVRPHEPGLLIAPRTLLAPSASALERLPLPLLLLR